MPPKQDWIGIDFSEALGMSSNVKNPGRKTARRILNLHAHEKPGKMVLRPGYTLRYATPDADDDVLFSTIGSPSYLNFDLFFDTNANVDGEMFCLIGKGTLSALSGSSVADTQKMIQVWVRPYVGQWEWINKTIITKLTGSASAPYTNVIKIFGDSAHGLGDDSLIGYTIYNKTKDQYAKIITCKVDAGELRINHTYYNSLWSINDVVIITKNWIETAYMAELYNAEWNDVVFHKIIKDLRIGFGGEDNRPGLAVGYRNRFLLLDNIDFASVHADLDAAAITAFSETDGIILDLSFLRTSGAYGIDLLPVTGTLTAGTYYFRLTGLIDGYAEQLVAENLIQVDGSQDVEAYPYINLAKINPRITKLILYKSEDNSVFYKINEYDVYLNESGSKNQWKIDENGRLYFDSSIELHTDSNAASIASEANATTGWEVTHSIHGALSSDNTFAAGGTYSLKYGEASVTSYSGTVSGIKYPITGLRSNTLYTVDVYLKGGGLIYVNFRGATTYGEIKVFTISGTFTKYTMQLNSGDDPLSLEIRHVHTGGAYFWADLVSIKTRFAFTPDTVDGAEMKDNMGYQPSFNVVKGWDQAKTYRGRAYYLNPYVDKRYENYILVSHLSGAGAFMYDISTFSNYRELERFDNSKAVGMEFLPNGDLLVLKDKSVESIDPHTNAFTREPIFGVNCLSRESIVNTGGFIRWCGSDDIYYLDLNGFRAVGILKDTIRDLYLAIVGKSDLHAVRDKYNTYRLRIYNETTKQEFLFVGKEPIEEAKYIFPLIYRIGYSARLFFMDTLGNIYSIDAEIDYNKYLTNEDWSDYIYEEGGTTKIPYEGT